MKRDMDLIRELLLKLESLPMERGDVFIISADDEALQIPRYNDHQIDYHLSLIQEAGLIDTAGAGSMTGYGFARLSWAGHDFLDSVRSPDVWDRTKQAASAAGGFTVDLLVFAAKSYLEGKIKGFIGA
ncbi:MULTISPECIES: DUF2513 domain-containing protein [Burkholderia cepacia complex]|uniref:DUF2513 domain-containing protein n=1 Tax=Burkholderia cepacia complex TaxID=87882 RepID=UPI001CB0C4B1|nr:DUF2513 domain-containing protein [Burkholderia cepacia]CAG9273398.1 conserved hypothetical protein [Burkholderia cepacia]